MKRSLGSHAGAINLNVEIPVADIGQVFSSFLRVSKIQTLILWPGGWFIG